MSEEMQSYSIVDTWLKAVTSPNEETYQQIANDPGASFGRSALWVFVAGIVGSFISGIVNYFRFTVSGSRVWDFLENMATYSKIYPFSDLLSLE